MSPDSPGSMAAAVLPKVIGLQFLLKATVKLATRKDSGVLVSTLLKNFVRSLDYPTMNPLRVVNAPDKTEGFGLYVHWPFCLALPSLPS